MTSAAESPVASVASPREPRTLASIAILAVVCFGLGSWSMLAPVLVLILGSGLVATWWNPTLARLHGSLLFGTALAWALLPHTVFDFRHHRLSPIATDIPGCQIMARAGFPIQLVSGHGGGGWRMGYHLLSDRLALAANCTLLSLAVWLLWRYVPRHKWIGAHLAACAAFVPLCFYGWAGMFRWWD